VRFGDVAVNRCAYSGGNNIFHSNGGWGVNLFSFAVPGLRGPNVYYNNTSGAATTDNSTDEAAVVDLVGTPITADPKYTSLVDGSEDFTLDIIGSAFQVGNPGATPAGVGTGYVSLGSLVPDEPSGGSTTVIAIHRRVR
jgi:hypothetical protein